MNIFGINILEPLLSGLFSLIFISFAFFIRMLLDSNMMPSLVRWLGFISLRSAEFKDYHELKGDWDHIYKTKDYEGPHKNIENFSRTLYQLSNRIYSTFFVNGEKYYIYGRFDGEHITGDWRRKGKRRSGYAGSFQLKVIDEDTMSGMWIGFSKTENKIRHGEWQWNRSKKNAHIS